MDPDAASILESVEQWLSQSDPTDPYAKQWIGGRVVTPTEILVIYRVGRAGAIIGEFLEFDDVFRVPDPPNLLGDVMDAIDEPDRTYFVEGVRWAEDFGLDSAQVQWSGIDPAEFGDRATAWRPPEEPPHEGPVTYSASWTRLKPDANAD